MTCDGACSADFELLTCDGGRLEGGCKVEAACDASCDVSVVSKAECKAMSVTIASNGASDLAAATKLKTTLEANLGAIVAFKERLEGMSAVAGVLGGVVSGVTDIKPACLQLVMTASGAGIESVTASLAATSAVTSTIGQ